MTHTKYIYTEYDIHYEIEIYRGRGKASERERERRKEDPKKERSNKGRGEKCETELVYTCKSRLDSVYSKLIIPNLTRIYSRYMYLNVLDVCI